MVAFTNPFNPGAGHAPPYLAGRIQEKGEFVKLLDQNVITENLVLTGLRGVGKTALLNSLEPEATSRGWLWINADLSEETSLTEENLAIRICADLAKYTSQFQMKMGEHSTMGFNPTPEDVTQPIDYSYLMNQYKNTPGLHTDKLKAVILHATQVLLHDDRRRGIIFAYDEAQNISNQPRKDVHCLSTLLDTFSSLQRAESRILLALTGLPTLFSKLVDARTYAERMFRVITLEGLSNDESEEAIRKPIDAKGCPVKLTDDAVRTIVDLSKGYPYFIQYICKETYDTFIQLLDTSKEPVVPVQSIVTKLDADFFAGRYAKTSDRERDLLWAIASLDTESSEFTVQEVVERSESLPIKPFSASRTNQTLTRLIDKGLIYRNRHGKYSFAVPMFASYIRRQHTDDNA